MEKQQENKALALKIAIACIEYIRSEAQFRLVKDLEVANVILPFLDDTCNVAIPKLVHPVSSLFETERDPQVYTATISNQVLTDFQKLRNKSNEDIRKTITALIEYYSNNEQLNIILQNDVLETRPSYTKFTAQLAHYLTQAQPHYTQIKVQFDATTSRLGIFCRMGSNSSSLNKSLIGSIVAILHIHNAAEVSKKDIPMSYLSNRAAFKFQIAQRLDKKVRLNWKKDSVEIFV